MLARRLENIARWLDVLTNTTLNALQWVQPTLKMRARNCLSKPGDLRTLLDVLTLFLNALQGIN